MRLRGEWLWPAALACEALARRGIEPRVTRDHLRMARKKMFFSHAKAAAELGFSPRPAREAVADAVAWFRANGMAPSMIAVAALSLLAWLYLALLHGRFWQAGPMLGPPIQARRPSVVAIVPARDEAALVARSDRLAAGAGLSRSRRRAGR